MNLIHGKQITPKISGLGLTLSNGVMSIVATNYFTFSNGLLEIDSSKFILQNGNIFGTTASIGTNDNYPLQLKTNNITSFVIATNGYVSIGNDVVDIIAATNTTRNFLTLKQNWTSVTGSNTLTLNALVFNNIINFTNSTNTIFRGLYYNPTVSNATTHRAIETTSGEVRFSGGSLVVNGIGSSANTVAAFHDVTGANNAFIIKNSGNIVIGGIISQNKITVNVSGIADGGITLTGGDSGAQYSYFGVVNPSINNDTFIGARSNNAFIIRTNHIDRVTITNIGNVGIGTSSTIYKLDVVSATAISARFDGRVIGVTAVNSNEFITLGQLAASASKYIFQNGNSFGLTFSIGTNDNYPLQLKTNNTVALTIATNGFVGIGTLIPTTKLDIRGKLNIISEYGNNGGIYVYANGNVDVIKVVGTGNIASGLDIDMSTSSNVQNGGIIYKHKTGSISPMQIWKSGDNTTLNILDSVGNFGIGIATPIYRLDVISGTSISARFDGRVIGATAVNNDEYVTLGQLAFSASNYFVQNGNSFGATAVLGTNDTQALYLETNNLNRLTIATNGFVGINTTTPTDLFEVRSGTYRRFIVGDGNTAYGGLAIERYANTQLGADEITIRRSRGSFGIGSAVLTGDILGNLQFDAGIGGTATVPFAPSTYISTYVNDSSVISATSTAIRGDIYIGSFVNTTPSLIIRGNLTSDFYGTINLNTLTASQNDILIISPTGSVGRTSSNIFLANSLTQSYFAQNGNSFGTTASIGSKDNYNLQIKSNDIERILISNTGTISFNVVGTPSLFTTSTYIFRGINPAFETTTSNLSFAIGAYNNFTNMSTNTIVAQIDMIGYRNNSTSTLGRIRTTYQGDGTNRTSDLIFSVGQSNNVISDRLYLRDNYSQFINRAVIIDNSVRSVTYSSIYGLEVGGSVLFSNILQLSYISGTQTDVMLISPTGTVSRTNSNLLTVGTATFALNSAFANGVTWSTITSKPTTLFGYGITDAVVYSTASYINPTWIISLEGSKITGVVGTATFALNSAFANGVTWSTITSKPTTLNGYGITDAVVYSTASYANPTWIISLEGTKITGTVGTASFALNSAFANGVTWSNITSKPTTLNGYGIIDAFAQNGNSFGATAVLGTNDNNILQFETNNNIALTIATNGYVGIGTISPFYKLDVIGDSRITNNLNIGGVLNLTSLISTQSDILLISASGSIGRTSSNIFLTGNYFAQNGNSFGTTASIGTNDNNVLLIKTNNTTAITVATNGYIGLGTNNPTQKLEVAGSVTIKKIDTNIGFYLYGNYNSDFGAQQIFYKNRSIAGIENAVATDDRIMEIRAYGHDGTTYQPSAKIMAEVEGTVATGSVAGRLTFYTTDIGASTYTEKMRISNNGYVGINTTNPLERLHVDGNIYVTGNLLIAGTSTQINTSNLTVTDAIIELATGQIGVNPTLDSGFIVNRGLGGSGSSNNVAFMWKEDIDEFVFIGTSNTASVISITISNYENIHARSLKLENGLYINNNILFTQSGDSYFNTNGYLGIGTSSPIYKLDVYSTHSISARFSGRVIGVTAVNSNEFITLGQLASSASNYFYQGGNSFGSNAVLGTIDNYTLQFKTNNTTKLTIGTNGNIGIGVTNPTSTLHIVSDSATINLNNKVGLYGFFGAALAIQPITSHSVGVLVAANPTDQNDITKTIFRVTDNTYVTPWFNIIGSGNIGVGTSSPLYKLDVVSSATISARFSGRVIGATAINNNEFITLAQLASSASNYFIQNGNSFGATAVLGTNDNQALQLKTNNITALTIATNGYIGIGTINPLYKIDIDDNIRIKFTNKIYFNDSNTSIGETSGLTLDSGHSTRPIRFLINSVESVRIATNGYVGIGTVSPTTRLQTTGSFSVYNGVDNISMTPNNTTTYINLLSQSISTYITANPQPDWSVSLGGSTIPNGVSLLNNSSGSWTNIGAAISSAGGGVRFYASQNGTYSDFWWYHNKTTQLMRLSRFGVLNISQLTGTQSDLLIIGTSGDVGRTSSTAFMAGNYFAQNGNSFDTTAVLGTNDNNDLLLKTNNNTRLIITKEGYVGFGMTSVGMHFNIKNTTNSARILNIMNSGNTTKMYITDDGQYFFTSTYSGSAPFNIQNTGSVRQAIIGNLEITSGDNGWGSQQYNIGAGWMRWITGYNLTMSNVYSFQGLKYLSNPVGSTWYSTSGNLNFFEIASNDYFSPTYGNATFNILNISGGVAQTGTASGVTRALYINPSATGNNFKWIETLGTSNPTSSVSNYQSVIFGHTINAKTHSQTLIGMYLNMNITSTYSNVNRYQLYSNGNVAIENNIGGGSIQLLGSNRRIHSHNGGGGNEIDFSSSGFGQLNIRPYADYNIYHQLVATTSINLDGRRTNLYQQLNLLYSTSNDTDLMIISSTGSVGRTSSNVYLASGLSQSYFMQNGNSFGATAVIGTNDSQQLHLETNGMPRMVVGTNGYIGINTTNPTDTFEIRSSSIRRFVAGDGNTAYGGVAIERYSNNPFGADEITIKRSRGVYNASTPVLNGDLLGSFQWNGGIGGTAADPFIQSTYISTYVNDDSVISATSTVIRGDIHLGSFINSTPTVILRNNLTSDFYGSVNLNTLTASQTDLVIISASGSIGRTSSTIFLADNYFAQNGNSFGATAVLGTIDNQALVFKTNNTQQLIIATNGNILIGTTTDTGYKLNINGTVYVGGTTTFASNIRVSNITPLINGDINILATWAGSTGVFIRTIKNTSQTLQVLPDTPNDNTLGTTNVLRVSNNFSPTAGNGINNALIIDGVINQTGTASGTIRGLYYNPTVSNIIGSHRAIETTAGDIIINGGKLGIGLTSPSYSLDIISGTSISARFDGRVIGATAINDNEFITLGQISLNSFINNGNSFGATAVLGTNDNQELHLETNGTTKMIVGTNNTIRFFGATDDATSNVYFGTNGRSYSIKSTANVWLSSITQNTAIQGVSGVGRIKFYTDNNTSLSLETFGYHDSPAIRRTIEIRRQDLSYGSTTGITNSSHPDPTLVWRSSSLSGDSYALATMTDNVGFRLETYKDNIRFSAANNLGLLIATNSFIGIGGITTPTHALDIATNSSIKIRALNHTQSQVKPLYVDSTGVLTTTNGTASTSPMIITDPVVIAALIDDVNNWDVNGNWIGGSLNAFAGQYYRNLDWFFFMYSDNDPMRMIRG